MSARYSLLTDMDQTEPPSPTNGPAKGFKFLVILLEIVGIVLMLLVTLWIITYEDSFAWNNFPTLQFNWHPLLMTIGFVFLYGNAMLIYRTQRNVRKRRLKLMHSGLMLFTVLFVIIALIAVFDSHNFHVPPIPNMYSLHSWVGLTTVILFCFQLLAGCISFLWPGIHASLRASYMPIHVYFGVATFVGVIASCLLGLTEKAIFALGETYSKFANEGMLINTIGLLFVTFGALTVYLVTQEQYKRQPRPEDSILLTNTSN